MMRKTVLAVTFGLALAGASPARADIDIDINLNYGGFYGRNISCNTGVRVLERRFNNVARRDCKGSRYEYSGSRNGKWYHIGVSAATGRIIAVKRWQR